MPGELANGAWVQPTIWIGLDDNATVVREEIFGPCTTIMPFDSEDEVIQSAPTTRPTVWPPLFSRRTSTAPTGLQRKWKLAWSGSTAGSCATLRTPFGGAKQSGIGREGGVHSLEFYTELKNVCIKL